MFSSRLGFVTSKLPWSRPVSKPWVGRAFFFGRSKNVKKKKDVETANSKKTEDGKKSSDKGDKECCITPQIDLKYDQRLKVTVVGAAGRVGRILSLLLKSSPHINDLCLYDIKKCVTDVACDLRQIDTKCCVQTHNGICEIESALCRSDVVVITAGTPSAPDLSPKEHFRLNAPIIASVAEACGKYCPNACIVVVSSPINSLVPAVAAVLKLNCCFNQRKLFGLTTLDVIRANTFVAEAMRKDPKCVTVPVVGGSSEQTIVPVISQAKPCTLLKKEEVEALSDCIRMAEKALFDCQNCGTPGSSTLSTAYAAFRFVSLLVAAMKGEKDIIECSYVASDMFPELPFFASPIRLGTCGVEKNFGYPPLSEFEVCMLEAASEQLMEDIKMGVDWVCKCFAKKSKDKLRKKIDALKASPKPNPCPEKCPPTKNVCEPKKSYCDDVCLNLSKLSPPQPSGKLKCSSERKNVITCYPPKEEVEEMTCCPPKEDRCQKVCASGKKENTSDNVKCEIEIVPKETEEVEWCLRDGKVIGLVKGKSGSSQSNSCNRTVSKANNACEDEEKSKYVIEITPKIEKSKNLSCKKIRQRKDEKCKKEVKKPRQSPVSNDKCKPKLSECIIHVLPPKVDETVVLKEGKPIEVPVKISEKKPTNSKITIRRNTEVCKKNSKTQDIVLQLERVTKGKNIQVSIKTKFSTLSCPELNSDKYRRRKAVNFWRF